MKFIKRKAYSFFKDNIWGADLSDMQLISKYNKVNIWGADLADMQIISKYGKVIRFLLCIIDTYSKYAWVVP